MKNILWTIINFILVGMPFLWHNNYSFIFIIISALSIPFLYNNFLISLKQFSNKSMTMKNLFKAYINAENFTYNNLKIFLGVVFSVQPLAAAIIYKYNIYYSVPLYLISILSFIGYYRTINSCEFNTSSLMIKR